MKSPSQEKSVLGIDIGGANLKFATGEGATRSIPFEMWNDFQDLPARIENTIKESFAASFDEVAITMTGELADCFESRQHGVEFIINAVEEVGSKLSFPIQVYGFQGFLDSKTAKMNFELVAAANWYAIAKWLNRHCNVINGLVLDCGSTTTDVIPVVDGEMVCGRTDMCRLVDRSLVYSGVRRTPLFGLVESVNYRGKDCAVSRELFTTTQDAYVVLNQINSGSETADGRSASVSNSVRRIGKLICADESNFELTDAIVIARQIASVQRDEIVEALKSQLKRCPSLKNEPIRIVIGGEGEFVLRDAASLLSHEVSILSVTELLGDSVSSCLGAYAVARLSCSSWLQTSGVA